jgi:dTDP-4-dehydrorhamnose 3,5-epimerase
MKVTPGKLDGLLVIEPNAFGDARGFFMETWNQQRYREAGMTTEFVQDNVSSSRRGSVRGLHFQNPAAQAKLVWVIQGEVFDVAVDIRRGSPTFGQWEGVNLSAENRLQFFIPPGFAHGFAVLSEIALFAYKCSDFYAPQHEMAILWNDPDIGIRWPVSDPVLSAKDQRGLRLRDVPPERLFP